jgi:hypothetical protein
MVFSENLLLGLVRVHQPTSEPEVLLKHFGRSVADLEREVQRVSGHHRPTQSPYSLTDLPRLSRNTQMAMELATRLSEEVSPGGTISAPILFGGLLHSLRALRTLPFRPPWARTSTSPRSLSGTSRTSCLAALR